MLDVQAFAQLDCTDIVRAVTSGEQPTDAYVAASQAALRAIADFNVVEEVYLDAKNRKDRGLLVGVPLAHKDSAAKIEGYGQEYGSRLARGRKASATSRFFELILDEGCSVVARTRVPELVLSVVGDNVTKGSPLNPFNLGRSMGGSTAGTAAVALGAVPVAAGADAGGSLRIPCGWAGCYTLKPTAGTVSSYPVANPLYDLDQLFVVTRSIRDLRLFHSILTRPDSRSFSYPNSSIAVGPSARVGRVAILRDLFSLDDMDDSVRQAMDRWATKVSRLGCDVVDLANILDFEEYCESLYRIFSVDLLQLVAGLSTREGARPEQPFLRSWLIEAGEVSAVDLAEAVEYVRHVRDTFSQITSQYDLVVSPSAAHSPPTVDTLHSDASNSNGRAMNMAFERLVQFTAVFNLSGHPALVMPSGYVDLNGVPIGLQIAGPAGSDRALFDFAEMVDPGFTPPGSSLALT